MSNIAVRKRRYTTTNLSSLTEALGEVNIDITKPTLVIHDGETPGGIPLAQEAHTHADATEGTAGFISASDKTKLDNLSETGAVQHLQSNGDAVPPEFTINFSTAFTLTDNPGEERTEIDISESFQNELNDNAIALILVFS